MARARPCWERGHGFALAALAFLLYVRTVGYGYALDDDFVTRKNRFVQQGVSGLPAILTTGYFAGFDGSGDKQYRPLCTASFALEVAAWGNAPNAHHLVNVLLYAGCAGLALCFLRRLLPSESPLIAAVIAALWVVHPVHTEAVANLKSRDELLAFLLAAGCLTMALGWERARWKVRMAGVGLLFLACASKESAVTTPFLVVLALHVAGAPVMQIAAAGAAHVGAAAAFVGIRTLVLTEATFGKPLDPIDNTLAAASSLGERLATATLILGKYLRLSLWPHPLSWDYSFASIPIVGWSHPGAILALVLHAGLVGLAFVGLRRRSPWALGIAIYLVGLALVSNLVLLIGSTMAERFLFFPSLGTAIAVGWPLARLAVNKPPGSRRAAVRAMIGALVVIASVRTIVRSGDWRDNATLFARDIRHAAGSARAHFALAAEERVAGERLPPGESRDALLHSSERENLEAVRIYPRFALAWYNLGVTYDGLRQPDAALGAYRHALEVDARYKEALNNTGVILYARGDRSQAEDYFTRAVSVDGTYVDALANLGASLHNRGDLEGALDWYERILRLDPGNSRALRARQDAMAALAGRPVVTEGK